MIAAGDTLQIGDVKIDVYTKTWLNSLIGFYL